MSFFNHFSTGSTTVSCRKCHPISLSQIWKSGSPYYVRRLYKVTIYTKECGLGQTGPSLHTGDAQLSSLLTFGPACAVLGLKLLLLATLTVQCLVDQTTQKGTVSSMRERAACKIPASSLASFTTPSYIISWGPVIHTCSPFSPTSCKALWPNHWVGGPTQWSITKQQPTKG